MQLLRRSPCCPVNGGMYSVDKPNRRPNKHCIVCGKPFYARPSRVAYGEGKYCSLECSGTARTTKLKCVCTTCGKEFYRKPSEIAIGAGKYCSLECRKTRLKCTCACCGKEFYTIPARIKDGRGKYCSRACQSRAKSDKLEFTCLTCGKIFYKKKSTIRLRESGKYCSSNCFKASRNHKITKTCRTCGQKFEVYPSGILHRGQGVYCSIECKKVGIRGEGNPAWLGGLSFAPYCPKFNDELKEAIREKYNRTCLMCGTPENGRKLSVHHINFDKKSGCFGKSWNLIPLDQKCHAWTSNHRFEAFNLLINHWLLNPEISLISYPFSSI
jgi:hypothetical protein